MYVAPIRFILYNLGLHSILLVSSLNCYSNVAGASKEKNVDSTSLRPIISANCTKINDDIKLLLEQIPDHSELTLHQLGCFGGLDICRVIYTDAGPEVGCSCKQETGPRIFRMKDDTCKDLTPRDSSSYDISKQLATGEINRVLARYGVISPRPLTRPSGITVYRICICTGNLCNDPSKCSASPTTKSTRTISNTYINWISTIQGDGKHSTSLSTTAKMHTVASSESSKFIPQPTFLPTENHNNHAREVENAWLMIYNMIAILSIVKLK